MNSDGEAELALQLGEELEHARLHRDVERRGRLVGDQQLGLERERAGEARALALAAGELVRVAVAERLGQLHRLEQLVDPRPRGLRRRAARPCTTSGSATHSAMVSSGLKLDAGSWKTKPIRSRTGRNARS